MNFLFVLIPSVAIMAMITYKALQTGSVSNENEKETKPLSHVSYVIKEKILPKFEKVCFRARFLFSAKIKNVHETLKENISGHYSTFNDAVNGREDVGNKGGVVSFFLKSVTDHKKKLRNRK